jgi:hypothetical protein
MALELGTKLRVHNLGARRSEEKTLSAVQNYMFRMLESSLVILYESHV